MYHENTASQPDGGKSGQVQAAPADQRLVIESRFGALAVAADHAVTFSNGLLGFEEYNHFALAELADPRYRQFKVLQCLDDHQLSFLVMPVDPASGIVDASDLAAACKKLSIEPDDLVILLVVTIRKTPDNGVEVSGNLRAPLLIDTAKRTGVQHVLSSETYPVRYPI